MKFNTIDELDAKVEKTVSNNVKYYFTDWKNYDRPKYMKFKGSNKRTDKRIILSVRDCGTYLYTEDEKNTAGSWGNTLYEYFHNYESAKHYLIDLEKLTFQKIA